MIIPAVMFIEMALDTLKMPSLAAEVEHELREFRALGTQRLIDLVDQMGYAGHLTDIERGYLIGLETARGVLMMNPVAVKADVKL